MSIEKKILEGELVRLEPLSIEYHKEGLCKAISDGELWNLYVTLVPHIKDIDGFFSNAEKTYNAGDGLAYATIYP